MRQAGFSLSHSAPDTSAKSKSASRVCSLQQVQLQLIYYLPYLQYIGDRDWLEWALELRLLGPLRT